MLPGVTLVFTRFCCAVVVGWKFYRVLENVEGIWGIFSGISEFLRKVSRGRRFLSTIYKFRCLHVNVGY